MKYKDCSKCKESKWMIYFSKSGRLKDGTIRYRSECDECLSIYTEKYRERKESGEHMDADTLETDMVYRKIKKHQKALEKAEIKLSKVRLLPESKSKEIYVVGCTKSIWEHNQEINELTAKLEATKGSPDGQNNES